MTAVTLACPHCAGNIQVDSAFAGQHVACPLCHGVLMLPPLDILFPSPVGSQPYQPSHAAHYPTSYPAPNVAQHEYPPTELASLFTLGCPACGNALQVSVNMSGQQVVCPYCATAVIIPPLQSQATVQPAAAVAQPSGPLPLESPSVLGAPSDLAMLLPPGAAPTPDPVGSPKQAPPAKRAEPREPTAADRLPPPRAPVSERAAPAPGSDRFPPTRSPRTEKTQAAEQNRGVPTPPANDRFPPGFGGGKSTVAKPKEPASNESKPNEDQPPAKPEEVPTVATPRDDHSSRTSRPQDRGLTTEAREDRLPPVKQSPRAAPVSAAESDRVSVPSSVEELLPPTGAPTPPKPLTEPEHKAPAADIAALLPPGADAVTDSMPASAVPRSSPTAPSPSVIDVLLPPGAREVNTAAVGAVTQFPPQQLVDGMLPPGAPSSLQSGVPGAEVPLPKMQPVPLRPVLAPGQTEKKPGLEALQTSGREGKKSVEEETQEAKKLTSEERGRRRFRRNAVVWSICLLILLLVFWYMAR